MDLPKGIEENPKVLFYYTSKKLSCVQTMLQSRRTKRKKLKRITLE